MTRDTARAKPVTVRPLDQRILEKYDDIPPSERILADILLEKKSEFFTYTASELAKLAGVSKATAVRLFRRLEYSSFDEARQSERDIRNWGSPLDVLGSLSSKVDIPGLSEHFLNDQQNLLHTFERIQPAIFNAALEALAKCRVVWILGARNSYGLAHYARFLFSMLKSDVRLLPVADLTYAEELVNMQAGDILFVIAFRRRASILSILPRKARELKAQIVLITDLSAVVNGKNSDFAFRCHSRGARSFDSYTAAISLINLFGTSLGLRLGATTRERLSAIEKLHQELHEFSDAQKSSDSY